MYKDTGWTNWGDFLGIENVRLGVEKNFRSFEECRVFARSLQLSGLKAWEAWRKVPGNRPADVPSRPDRAYKDASWTNWGDFLGTGNKVGRKKGE